MTDNGIANRIPDPASVVFIDLARAGEEHETCYPASVNPGSQSELMPGQPILQAHDRWQLQLIMQSR